MEATVIAAFISACVIIFTTILTSFLNRRAQIRLEERKLKEVYYAEFIKGFSDNINLDNETDAVKALCYAQNNLFLIANVDVINKMQHLDLMCINNGTNFEQQTGLKKGTPEFINEYDRRVQSLMIAIRADLYGNNESGSYPIIHFKTSR